MESNGNYAQFTEQQKASLSLEITRIKNINCNKNSEYTISCKFNVTSINHTNKKDSGAQKHQEAVQYFTAHTAILLCSHYHHCLHFHWHDFRGIKSHSFYYLYFFSEIGQCMMVAKMLDFILEKLTTKRRGLYFPNKKKCHQCNNR